MMEPVSRAMVAGTFLMTSTMVRTGTISSRGEMVKEAFSASVISFRVFRASGEVVLYCRPSTKYRTREMTKAGVMVQIMDLMWVNTSVPAAAGAMLVVSEKGDILSPNTAPEMDIPATRAGLMPMPRPMVMKAIPMVPRAA